MPRPVPIYFNGKFYAGPLGGVHRVADCLIRAIDKLAKEQGSDRRWDLRLLLPRERRGAPDLTTFRVVEQDAGHTQHWEQMILPYVARDGFLVNLANLAPIMHRAKITLMHDAQFRLPQRTYALRYRLGYRYLTPLMARSSRTVLTVSEHSRAMLDSAAISPKSHTIAVHNGADHIRDVVADPFIVTRHRLAAGRYAVVFGSVHQHKNVETVFRAFRECPIDGVKLVVVGQGRDQLIAAGIEPPPDAVFVGGINDRELRALYESALCLLYPSFTEGFGLPPLEAMMCGCPAIVSPRGAIPEVCGDAAIYADPENAAAWTSQILTLTRNAAMRNRKIAEGRGHATTFTWERAGIKLMAIVNSFISPGQVNGEPALQPIFAAGGK